MNDPSNNGPGPAQNGPGNVGTDSFGTSVTGTSFGSVAGTTAFAPHPATNRPNGEVIAHSVGGGGVSRAPPDELQVIQARSEYAKQVLGELAKHCHALAQEVLDDQAKREIEREERDRDLAQQVAQQVAQHLVQQVMEERTKQRAKQDAEQLEMFQKMIDTLEKTSRDLLTQGSQDDLASSGIGSTSTSTHPQFQAPTTGTAQDWLTAAARPRSAAAPASHINFGSPKTSRHQPLPLAAEMGVSQQPQVPMATAAFRMEEAGLKEAANEAPAASNFTNETGQYQQEYQTPTMQHNFAAPTGSATTASIGKDGAVASKRARGSENSMEYGRASMSQPKRSKNATLSGSHFSSQSRHEDMQDPFSQVTEAPSTDQARGFDELSVDQLGARGHLEQQLDQLGCMAERIWKVDGEGIDVYKIGNVLRKANTSWFAVEVVLECQTNDSLMALLLNAQDPEDPCGSSVTKAMDVEEVAFVEGEDTQFYVKLYGGTTYILNSWDAGEYVVILDKYFDWSAGEIKKHITATVDKWSETISSLEYLLQNIKQFLENANDAACPLLGEWEYNRDVSAKRQKNALLRFFHDDMLERKYGWDMEKRFIAGRVCRVVNDW